MQLLKSVALSMLAATAIAAEPHHAHRREAEAEPVLDYVTVYNTFYVTKGHEAAAAEATTVQAAPVASTPASVPTTTTSPEWSAPKTTEAPATSSSTSSQEAPSTTASSSAPAASSTSGGSGAGPAGARGIVYSPYNADGTCKSYGQVASDLEKLSGYDIIRIYGTDCNQVSTVNSGKASHQKLFAGIFDVSNIESELDALHSGLNGDWSQVNTVSIGNELVNDGKATVSQVAGYVQTARSKLASLGYTGPVVAVDTFIATINNPGLCDISDYLAVNAHAYFDGGVTSSEAGPWALEQIERVWSACGGKKPVTIVETGWPSQGPSNGKAVCSPQDQSNAIDSLKASVGNDAFLFTAYNDLWKPAGVEQWWGIYGNSQN